MEGKIAHLLESVPFLLMSVDGKVRGNRTRLIEAAMIVGILAGMGYMAVKGIEAKLSVIEKSIEVTNAKVDKIYSDIYRPVVGR